MAVFLFQVFVISLSGVMAPGPVSASAIAMGSRNRLSGLLIGLGHCIVELPLVILLMFGLGSFFKLQLAQVIIGFAGGAFLLFMAIQMFRSISKTAAEQEKTTNRSPLLTGIMLSASNPYFPLWWLAVGLNLVVRAVELGAWALVLFAAVHWLCDCLWLEVLSWASFKGTEVFGVKAQKILLGICATALAAFALYFLSDVVRTVLSSL